MKFVVKEMLTPCLKQHAVRMDVTLAPCILKLGIKKDTGGESVSTVWEAGGAAKLIWRLWRPVGPQI